VVRVRHAKRETPVPEEVLPELAQYPVVMTSGDVARALNIREELAIKHMRAGKLPGFKVGGSWRVRRADIQQVMEGTWQPAGHPADDE
jgi:excisionase family DNA binding protein